VQRVGLFAAGVAALVGILFVAALIAILSLRSAESRESHSKDVSVAALRVKARSADLESALRGYVLSENPRFLGLFRAARARVHGDVGTLRGLVRDDPPQRVRADQATAELNGYVMDYAENVIVIEHVAHKVAAGQAAGAEGKRRIDEINGTLQQLLAAENGRARQASAH